MLVDVWLWSYVLEWSQESDMGARVRGVKGGVRYGLVQVCVSTEYVWCFLLGFRICFLCSVFIVC